MTGGFERTGLTEADVDRLAAQIGLTIAPEFRVDEFTLPESVEPAPNGES